MQKGKSTPVSLAGMFGGGGEAERQGGLGGERGDGGKGDLFICSSL